MAGHNRAEAARLRATRSRLRARTSAGQAGDAAGTLFLAPAVEVHLDDAANRASEFGSAGRALAEQPEATRAAARAAIRAAIAPLIAGAGPVTMPGAVWLVTAARDVLA